MTVDEQQQHDLTPAKSQLPPELVKRLEGDGHVLSEAELDAKLKAAAERKEVMDAEKMQKAHEDVERTRLVPEKAAEEAENLKAKLDKELSEADQRREQLEEEKLHKIESHLKAVEAKKEALLTEAQEEKRKLDEKLAAAESRRKALEEGKVQRAKESEQHHHH